MKALTRLLWGGFWAFIACLAVGLMFAGSTNTDISTFALFLSLPSAATMLLAMVGMHDYRGDESKARHASYCLHCAQGLAQDVKHWLEHNDPKLAEARQCSDDLLQAAESLERLASMELTSESRDMLARLYPNLQPTMENAFRQGKHILDHLRSHQSAMEKLALTVNEMTALSRHAHFLKGTYRTGPAPAGQLLYAGQQEPQHEVVILSHSLNVAIEDNKQAIDTLEAALGLAQPTFWRFAHHLASSK
ncbi:MAG: hypothetical protein JST01_23845 [Cyanobacteria bacterium SZAS TMP-1]|nr:hypothetical protein [Cyanobacteria bacterium SZAS TMP-1]